MEDKKSSTSDNKSNNHDRRIWNSVYDKNHLLRVRDGTNGRNGVKKRNDLQ